MITQERRHAIQNKVKLTSKQRGREKDLKDNKTDTQIYMQRERESDRGGDGERQRSRERRQAERERS